MLGVACTAGGFTAFFALIKRAGPTTAALTTYTAPIIAVVAGVLVLDENADTLAGTQLLTDPGWCSVYRVAQNAGMGDGPQK